MPEPLLLEPRETSTNPPAIPMTKFMRLHQWLRNNVYLRYANRLRRERSLEMPTVLRSSLGPGAQNEGMSKCEEDVLNCFPDICPDYLKAQAAEHHWDSQNIITNLLDGLEKGEPYPKRPVSLKRKRPEKIEEKDEEEEMRRKFDDEDPRAANKGQVYHNLYTKKA